MTVYVSTVLIQITKCRLAELKVPEGRWSPEAVLLVKEAVLGAEDCKIMVTFYDVSTVRASLHDCITHKHIDTHTLAQ